MRKHRDMAGTHIKPGDIILAALTSSVCDEILKKVLWNDQEENIRLSSDEVLFEVKEAKCMENRIKLNQARSSKRVKL